MIRPFCAVWFFLFLVSTGCAQSDSAVIHFAAVSSKRGIEQFPYNIQINGQVVATAKINEHVKCVAYSEGRVSIVIGLGTVMVNRGSLILDVKKGNTYYVVCDLNVSGTREGHYMHIADQAEADKVISRTKGEYLVVEDLKTPWNSYRQK